MDTCASCFAEPLPPAAHPYATNLEDPGRTYRAYRSIMERWRRVLDRPLLELDYEALVSGPEPQTRRLLEFCGLPWDERCLRHHEVAGGTLTLSYEQVRKPPYRSAVGRHRRCGARLAPLRKALGDFVPPT
jgi:hypothetical protein